MEPTLTRVAELDVQDRPIRLAVLDIGSVAATVQVVSWGQQTTRTITVQKARTGLSAHTVAGNRITGPGLDRVADSAARMIDVARETEVDLLVGYATAAVRDAANAREAYNRIQRATGVTIGSFSPLSEARLRYLAARNSCRPTTTPIQTVHLGGGTLEIAAGSNDHPEYVQSFPFGAATLTRDWLTDRTDAPQRRAARRYVTTQLASLPRQLARGAKPLRTFGTSRLLSQLFRLTATGRTAGDRGLSRAAVQAWIPRLAALDAEQRARLPGISRSRAEQSLAATLIVDELLAHLSVSTLSVCRGNLRDGVIHAVKHSRTYADCLDGAVITQLT
jgi:exopolyphosphatase/guanosine-5'-triphosphate,3'-diphosphate pyrophosphatase